MRSCRFAGAPVASATVPDAGLLAATRHAPTGMVTSVDHLASSAGVDVLRRGGSAADAAVAANAVLAVTCPHLCGMGGDLFALVHDPAAAPGGGPSALDASGRAGSGADAARLRAEGHTAMPFHGDVRAVTVPGCVDGWLALHARYGRLPLATVLAAATGYAVSGFPASPRLATAVAGLGDTPGAGDLTVRRPLAPGATVRRPGVGGALDAIAVEGRAGFYGGAFGTGLLALGAGEYTPADLDVPLGRWVGPIAVHAFGHDLWTVPAPSQGYLTLLGAAIADGLDLPDEADARWAHLLIEAARAAAHDRLDVLFDGADLSPLLAAEEVARRRDLVDPERRSALPSGTVGGGTMHLCAADGDGMAVSLIQSNASGFGSGLFEPATGIGLHNRGLGFSVVDGHPAEYRPGHRPPHTLSPALVTHVDGTLAGVVGTMGGDSQPQLLLQILVRWLRHGATPGVAVAADRWTLSGRSGFDTWTDPAAVRVRIEAAAAPTWQAGLVARRHTVEVAPVEDHHGFGHAHLIARSQGGWAGAAEPRAEVGAAAGY
jgi:gamma-glutamyltranspeptidase/glutathione hydrolase